MKLVWKPAPHRTNRSKFDCYADFRNAAVDDGYGVIVTRGRWYVKRGPDRSASYVIRLNGLVVRRVERCDTAKRWCEEHTSEVENATR